MNEKYRNAALRVAGAAVWMMTCLKPFRDLVIPFARGVLGRLDLLPSLTARDADEASYCVRLPLRGSHDLCQRRAFGAFISAMTSAYLLVRSALLSGFFARPALLAALAFFAAARLAFGGGAPGSIAFWVSIVVVLIMFLLDQAAVVTIHHSGWEKQQVNSPTIRLRPHQGRIGSVGIGGVGSFLCTRQNA